jgi:hypothetical protein
MENTCHGIWSLSLLESPKGREGGRERGREERTEGGREEGRKGGKDGERERGRRGRRKEKGRKRRESYLLNSIHDRHYSLAPNDQ